MIYLKSIELDKNYILDAPKYIQKISAVKNLNKMIFEKHITFFIGENGTGKSTLLEAIAAVCRFNPEGGSKHFTFSTKNTHSNLYKHLKMVRGICRPKDGYFLRAESFYNVATNIDDLDEIICDQPPIKDAYGGESLHNQSHGEGFVSLIMKRFLGNGLYILDEPESALSPSRQLAVLVKIHELVKQNSQFIIATHSPILMALPGSQIFEFNEKGITPVGYEQTEHYSITKHFLNNTEGMLNQLLS